MSNWAHRIKEMRLAKGWSLDQAAVAFCAASDAHTEDQLDSARRQIIRWEAGKTQSPNPASRAALARMFDLPERDLFPSTPLAAARVPAKLAPDAWSELITEMRSGSVSSAALEQAAAEVDRLCTEYASSPGQLVLAEADEWGRELVALKGSVNLSGFRETLRLLGWLSLLRSCLLYDAGDERAADRARQQAVSLGQELGDGPMVAWGSEITAWIALTKGDLAQVIAAVNAGVAAAPNSDVAAQLHAQAAKAYSRMGDRHKTEVELDHVRRVLDAVPAPENVRNHFNVDPTKASFYAMDAYRVLGVDALADAMATHVIETSQNHLGEVISPMRLSEAELTKATLAARQGDASGAISLTERALNRNRQSIPSLRMVAAETAREIGRVSPEEGDAFRHHLLAL